MRIQVRADVRLPRPPNYLRYGDDDEQWLDVADLTNDALRELAAAWTEQLIKHAEKRRKLNAEAKERK